MFSEPKRDFAGVSVDGHELAEDELSIEVAQLENDSGVSGYDVRRFLSIGEVLAQSER